MKITEALKELRVVEQGIVALEEHVKSVTAVAKDLRHDFNNVHHVITLLVDEVEHRVPFIPAATKP